MRPRIAMAVGIALVASAAYGLWRWRTIEERNNAIRGSGIIEVTQVDAAFEIPGRIAERFADEGIMLDKGEPVAHLDEREYQLQVERAGAALSAAQARYRLVVSGARAQEVDQALAAVEAAESALQTQRREHERATQLRQQGVVSQSEYDKITTVLADAQAARDRSRSQLDVLREGFRTEEIEEARARVRQAETEHELAELNLQRCNLMAPIHGRVLSKSREPGEMVQPGTPVVTIGDLTRPWVNLYVSERDLGKVRLGMKAKVSIDSYPGQPFDGQVIFVADRAEFTPKNIQTPDERVKLVYRVKIEIEPRDGALKPGMPADAVLPLVPER